MRSARSPSAASPSTGAPSAAFAGAAVGLTVLGMLAGTLLLLFTGSRAVGWLVFVLSFGGWLAAALLAMRVGWARGWFDR